MAESLVPDAPVKFNGSGVMQRMVDAILIRYTIVTEGISETSIKYQATPESMSMVELQKHILFLINWVAKVMGMPKDPNLKRAETFEEYQQQIKKSCTMLSAHIANMSDEEISAKTVYLKRSDTHYSIWYLISGPMSDAISHIGQIATWRRIAGDPIPRISPFTGEEY